MHSAHTNNKSQFPVFYWIAVIVVLAAAVMVRWPIVAEISIDDTAFVNTRASIADDLTVTFARWNRYIVVVFIVVVDFFGMLTPRFISLGYVFSAVSLFGLLAVASLYFSHGRMSKWLALACASFGLLSAVYYPLLHFHLIQHSLAFVFLTLALVLYVAKRHGGLGALFVLFTFATFIVAGSYQSGLYGIFLVGAAIFLSRAAEGANFAKALQVALVIGAGMVAGMALYSTTGVISATIAEPKDIFQSRPIGEWLPLALERLVENRQIFRNFAIYDGLITRGLLVVSAIVTLLIIISRRISLVEKLAVGFFLLVWLACKIQLLTIPVTYDSMPIRAFWFMPLAFVMFLSYGSHALVRAYPTARSAPLGFMIVLFGVLAFLNLYQTWTTTSGYTKLRDRDREVARFIDQSLRGEQAELENVAMAWSSIRQRNIYHRGVYGALRSLFWTQWSAYDFLEIETGRRFAKPGQKLRQRALQHCSKTPNTGVMPRIDKIGGDVVICF